ncbi:MAG: tRNA uridine-5-carboxymethylaminomethyl(34) synthesis GTPase MnmE [Proteobacteria bacterium]|nr:tRNA uridine-5-carboxymethylaminomethyl(34) synthesis GTPase MnmE [Pseudomonadota bacterium]
MSDTIYALSSGSGRAGIAVIRVSGPAAGPVYSVLTGRDLPGPRVATRVRLCDPDSGESLDDGLALWFPAPGSFTGEDVLELHVHGFLKSSPAVLAVLARQPGLAMAKPGAFTRRAFLAGKLDLTGAEGLIDLIDAETEAQRRQALRQSGGALGDLYENWRERLLRVLAHFEALIDFPEEELPESVMASVEENILGIARELSLHLADDRRGERLREGVQIAILGPPNVGKSSLLNLLSRRDAAIVSSQAGTTRDIVEVHLDLGGYPVVLADTAGIRESGDAVEAEGVSRARARARTVDLKLVVCDAAAPGDFGGADLVDADTIVVINKIDLLPGVAEPLLSSPALAVCPVSVQTGAGIDRLLVVLGKAVADRFGLSGAPVITRARHREAVEECRDSLVRAGSAPLPELAAEDLRLAVRALGRITGTVDVEDLLDIIFRDFCIGK